MIYEYQYNEDSRYNGCVTSIINMHRQETASKVLIVNLIAHGSALYW